MADPGTPPQRVMVLGLGFSGMAIATHLHRQGVEVHGTVRAPRSAELQGIRVHALVSGQRPDAALLAALANTDAVVCSVPPDAHGDPALRLLADALSTSESVRWVGYLSSTAVYADRAGGWVDETSAADAQGPSAEARLLAESQWRAFAAAHGCGSAVLRLPGLYGRGRNALLQLAQGRARHVLRPGLKFNRLHVEDLASVVCAAMHRPDATALYLPADDEPAPPQDVLAFAAALSGRELPPAQAWDDPTLSESLRRFYASNKRVDSRATRGALQWRPRFASYREGLQDAWDAGDGR